MKNPGCDRDNGKLFSNSIVDAITSRNTLKFKTHYNNRNRSQ